MARRNAIPDPLKRRHLLEAELDPARALSIAEAYLQEGRQVEALAFLRKAGEEAQIEALRSEAVSAGDVFLLKEASVALRREIDPATWQAVAEAAAEAGKDMYAQEARRMAAALEG